MKTTMTNLKQRMASFDQDERGMETLQTVLIVAVAAMILALIVSQWDTIQTWAVNAINQVTGEDMTEVDDVESF
jgi:hypothetical protein